MRFIFDEEEIFAGIGFNARNLGEQMSQPSTRGFRTTPFFGTYVRDPRATKQEGIASLKSMYDISSQFPKGGQRGMLIHEFSYLLAAGLIVLDPLDKFRD